MHTRLSFRVDILVGHHQEDLIWMHQSRAVLQICSKQFNVLECLTPHLKYLRRLSIKIWFTRKVANDMEGDRAYTSNSARSIKDHVNNLVIALQQSPCLKAIEVELQIIREVRPYDPPTTPPPARIRRRIPLRPAILDHQEIEEAIEWYLNPFKLLRNIEMKCRYIAGKSLASIPSRT